MAVTSVQQKMLAATARRANRRLERATPGQRAYLEKQIKGYHTRTRESGARVFQQGKAGSETEYRARMRELRRFLGEDEKKVYMALSEDAMAVDEISKACGLTLLRTMNALLGLQLKHCAEEISKNRYSLKLAS